MGLSWRCFFCSCFIGCRDNNFSRSFAISCGVRKDCKGGGGRGIGLGCVGIDVFFLEVFVSCFFFWFESS